MIFDICFFLQFVDERLVCFSFFFCFGLFNQIRLHVLERWNVLFFFTLFIHLFHLLYILIIHFLLFIFIRLVINSFASYQLVHFYLCFNFSLSLFLVYTLFL